MAKDGDYEWDDAKALANAAKHGVPFGAVREFDWPRAVIIPDRRRDYGEPRYMAYGNVGKRLHALVFTVRGARIRVISLRKANDRERRRYQKWMTENR